MHYTPGHTPADASYKIGDVVFVVDTLFMPDYGTRRGAAWPARDAHKLYASIQRLLTLQRQTRLFMCHDYKAPGRDATPGVPTVAEQRAHTSSTSTEGVSEQDFVTLRTAGDATLAAPVLLLPSIQTNIRAGRFPPAHANGVRYLTIPVTFQGRRGSLLT